MLLSRDLSPVLLGKRVDGPIRTTAILQTGRGLLAFRQGDWKLRFTKAPKWTGQTVTFPDTSYELYNLAADPYEQTNLADSKPNQVVEMQRRLLDLIERGRSR